MLQREFAERLKWTDGTEVSSNVIDVWRRIAFVSLLSI
jgi:hypothetical protein